MNLSFNEPSIKAKNVIGKGKNVGENTTYIEDRFGDVLIDVNKVCNTLVTQNRYFYDKSFFVDNDTFKKVGSYPMDYDFKGLQPLYLIGMSVPPVMTANIATEIYIQWLNCL